MKDRPSNQVPNFQIESGGVYYGVVQAADYEKALQQ
jgi:hypothetical protein